MDFYGTVVLAGTSHNPQSLARHAVWMITAPQTQPHTAITGDWHGLAPDVLVPETDEAFLALDLGTPAGSSRPQSQILFTDSTRNAASRLPMRAFPVLNRFLQTHAADEGSFWGSFFNCAREFDEDAVWPCSALFDRRRGPGENLFVTHGGLSICETVSRLRR